MSLAFESEIRNVLDRAERPQGRTEELPDWPRLSQIRSGVCIAIGPRVMNPAFFVLPTASVGPEKVELCAVFLSSMERAPATPFASSGAWLTISMSANKCKVGVPSRRFGTGNLGLPETFGKRASMSVDFGYRPPPTTVKCDNPKCNALYEISNLLGGHTFTCNKCGGKVTVRDVSTSAKPARAAVRWALFTKRERRSSSTPLLDAIVAANSRKSRPSARMVLIGLILILAIVGVWRWSATRTPPMPVPTLQEAIASGTVTAEFIGIGGSSGDSVRMQLSKGTNAGNGPVELSLPPGSVLLSNDPNAQSMMVVGVRGIDLGGNRYQPESQILLNGNEAVVYLLAAYCIQFEKQNPSAATRFTLKPPNPVLACMAEKKPQLPIPAMQAAVWMQTDRITYAHMNKKFPVNAQDWGTGQSVFLECRNVGGG